MNRKMFLKCGLIGSVISLFTAKIVANRNKESSIDNVPALLTNGEYVINKKLATDIDTKKLAEIIKTVTLETIIKQQKNGGLLYAKNIDVSITAAII